MIPPKFRLERIFQSIKLNDLRRLAALQFRLERIFQSIKLQVCSEIAVPNVPARAHFPID